MATDKAIRQRGRPKVGVQVATALPFVLELPRSAKLTVSPEMFWKICCENRDLRLELTAKGKLIVMAPAGGESGGQNADLVTDLNIWCRTDGTGKIFDSSTGFTLPNGAVLAPDASWIKLDRYLALSLEQRKRFPPICPDFVAELRSPSDGIRALRRKMREYVAQGVRLGWLLDPITGQAEVYRPGRDAEVLDRPATLSGEEVLPGFVLNLRGILFDDAV